MICHTVNCFYLFTLYVDTDMNEQGIDADTDRLTDDDRYIL